MVIVLLQGLFGIRTVTLLKPVIVTLHLLSGLTLVAFLAGLFVRHLQLMGGQSSALRGIRTLAAIRLIVLGMQIALGGWVSTNSAVLTDFVHGFHFCASWAWPPNVSRYRTMH